MAEFLDSGSPGFVTAPNGLLVDVTTLGPGDTVVKPVAGAAPNMPAPPAAVPAPMTAADVLAKRDRVLPPTPGLVTSSVSTTTTPGVSAAVLQPVLDRNTATGERGAAAVERAGDERATRREGAAMADNAQAFGRQQVAVKDEADAEQRAAIARQNELALSLQKDPEIDPDRYVRGMTTGQSILTTILATVNGAFKGMVGQQGNDVMDILKTRIEQDVAAQREQLQSGRIRRGNLISYFQNQGLREDAAAKAAEATSWAMLERMANNERDRALAGDERTSAELLGEQIRGQVQAKNDELLLTLGTPRSQTTVTKERPQPAAGAGLEAFSRQLAARKAYEESGATPEQLAEFDKALGMPAGLTSPAGESETARTRREAGDKRTEDQAKASGAMAGLMGFGTDAGLVLDPQTGDFRANPSDTNTFNARQRERAGSIIPGSSVKLDAAADAAIEGFGRLQSGGVISDNEAERFKKMIGDAVTDAQLAERLNSIKRIVSPRLAAKDRETMGGGRIPYPEVTP